MLFYKNICYNDLGPIYMLIKALYGYYLHTSVGIIE